MGSCVMCVTPRLGQQPEPDGTLAVIFPQEDAHLVEEEADHAGDALVAPVPVHQQEGREVPELGDGKVGCHDSLRMASVNDIARSLHACG